MSYCVTILSNHTAVLHSRATLVLNMPTSKKAGPGRKQKASPQTVSPDKQKPCKACRAQKVKCTHNSQLRRSERRTDPRDLGERRVSSSDNAQKDSPATQVPVRNDPALEHFNLILQRLDGIDNNVTSLADRVGAIEAESERDVTPNFRSTPDRAARQAAHKGNQNRPFYGHLMEMEECSHGCEGHARSAKSGYTKSSHDYIVRSIAWPHTMVHRLGAPPPKYDSLAVHEFTIGQLRINSITSNNDDAWVNTPEYLLELLEKINHNEWPVVRAAHRTVLHAIEHGHANPTDATKLRGIRDDAIRQPHQHRPQQGQHSHGGNHSNNNNHAMFYDPNIQPGQRPCQAFQQRACTHRGDHTGDEGEQCHACAHCWQVMARRYPHAEIDCRRKAELRADGRPAPKNEGPGARASHPQ